MHGVLIGLHLEEDAERRVGRERLADELGVALAERPIGQRADGAQDAAAIQAIADGECPLLVERVSAPDELSDVPDQGMLAAYRLVLKSGSEPPRDSAVLFLDECSVGLPEIAYHLGHWRIDLGEEPAGRVVEVDTAQQREVG